MTKRRPATHKNPCRTIVSAICSASPPGAKATGRRSAAWSTAARPASRSPRPRSRPISTSASPGQSHYTTQRQEPDQVRILSGVFRTRTAPGHHRNADRARDREHGCAVQGLWRHQGQVPPRPCRLHLSPEIRRARLARLGPCSARETATRVAAGAMARKVCLACLCAARSCRSARTRSTARLGLGRGRATTRSSARTPRRRGLGRSPRPGAQGGSSVGAVIEIVADGVPAGLGRADLRQARPGHRLGADEHQRGQGGGDRRWLRRRRRCPARRMPTRCAWTRRNAGVPVEPCRRHSRRHLDRAADGGALRGKADLLDPDAAATIDTARATTPRFRPRAATTPASASARCRSARRWSPSCWPTTTSATAARPAKGDGCL